VQLPFLTVDTIMPGQDYLATEARNLGFTHQGFVSTNGLRVSEEVRSLCESNSCGKYGRNWMCPPAIGDLESLEARVRSFGRACVVQYVDTIEDSFDFEGMQRIADAFDEKLRSLRTKARDWFRDHGAGDTLTVGAGACRYCEECSYQSGEACIAPSEALSSVEAYGFNVKPIVEMAGLSYMNGHNTVSYVGLVFFGGGE
jgi:predicted metal-binding protein